MENSSDDKAQPDRTEALPTPFGAQSLPGDRKSIIALANFLTLQVAVFDRGKPVLQHMTGPFMSIPQLKFQKHEADPDGQTDADAQDKQDEFSFSVPAVALAISSRQTEVSQSLERMSS